MKVLAVIPCRLNSTRLPQKPLIKLNGKYMLQHVAEGVSKSDKVDRWLIATDSQKILDTVKGFGGEAVLTRRDHPTGTDRISEVVKNLPGFEIILNIQGDEPLVNTSLIDSLILPLMEKQAEVSTLKRRVSDPKEINNPNIVKVK